MTLRASSPAAPARPPVVEVAQNLQAFLHGLPGGSPVYPRHKSESASIPLVCGVVKTGIGSCQTASSDEKGCQDSNPLFTRVEPKTQGERPKVVHQYKKNSQKPTLGRPPVRRPGRAFPEATSLPNRGGAALPLPAA